MGGKYSGGGGGIYPGGGEYLRTMLAITIKKDVIILIKILHNVSNVYYILEVFSNNWFHHNILETNRICVVQNISIK